MTLWSKVYFYLGLIHWMTTHIKYFCKLVTFSIENGHSEQKLIAKKCNKTRDGEVTWVDLTSGCMIKIIIISCTCLNDGFWNSITSKIPENLWLPGNLIAITSHNCRFTRTNRTWIRTKNKAQFQMSSETWFSRLKIVFLPQKYHKIHFENLI